MAEGSAVMLVANDGAAAETSSDASSQRWSSPAFPPGHREFHVCEAGVVPRTSTQPQSTPSLPSAETSTAPTEQPRIIPIAPSVLPNRAPLRSSFRCLQRWVGVVTELDDTGFAATLTDPSQQLGDIFVHLERTQLARDDLRLLEVGAVFYLSIGYRTLDSGQQVKAHSLHFRRLPAWTRFDEWRSRQRRDKLRAFFSDEA